MPINGEWVEDENFANLVNIPAGPLRAHALANKKLRRINWAWDSPDVNGSSEKVGNRIAPSISDGTGWIFEKCNLRNVETPPNCTLNDCYTAIQDRIKYTKSLTIDGETGQVDVYRHYWYGRWLAGAVNAYDRNGEDPIAGRLDAEEAADPDDQTFDGLPHPDNLPPINTGSAGYLALESDFINVVGNATVQDYLRFVFALDVSQQDWVFQRVKLLRVMDRFAKKFAELQPEVDTG